MNFKSINLKTIPLSVLLILGSLLSNAQQSVRDNFLVEKISRYESATNYADVEYIYDANNKLICRNTTGKFVENSQLRDLHHVDSFEYENGLVSKVKRFDYTHFMFDHDFHFTYNAQGNLIRRETWKNNTMLNNENYHYENGKVVSTYLDNMAPFETDTIFYNNDGNVSKRVRIYPETDLIGNPIPGQFIVRELTYNYDNHPRPNFGLDYLIGYQPIPWMIGIYELEMNLSNNNLIKAFSQEETNNYTYDNNGLPATIHHIFDPIGPLVGNIFTISYKQIGTLNISKVDKQKLTIYPNPTVNSFTIDPTKPSTIKLFDMNGRAVLHKHLNGKTEINISHLSQGIYNLSLVSDDQLLIGNSQIIKK